MLKNYDHPNEVMKWARELLVDFLLNIHPNWPQYNRALHHQAAERFQYFKCGHYLYCQNSLLPKCLEKKVQFICG